jgi:hypothetical protein
MNEQKYRDTETRLINIALLVMGMDLERFIEESKRRTVDYKTNGLSAVMPDYKIRVLADDALAFKRAIANYCI